MKKRFIKAVSVLLTVMLLVGVAPVSVMTAFATDVKEAAPEVKERITEGAKELYSETKAAVSDTAEKVKTAATTGTDGDYEYRILEDGTAEITKYNGSATDVVIPEKVDGYTVTIIGNRSKYAGAFSSKGVISVVIPNSVTRIREDSFGDCVLLTNITIPDSVTTIEASAFSGCTSLTNIEIPDSVTSIGEYAFSFCESLTNLTIPNSVTFIGESAFSFCTSLTNIEIPNSVTVIKSGVFAGCTSLTDIAIPNSVTFIGQVAFGECTSLTNIMLPDSLEVITISAFRGCKSLVNITIPKNVKKCDETAFEGCYGLQEIFVDPQNRYYCVVDGVLFDKDKTHLIKYPSDNKMTSYTISKSVYDVGIDAFEHCMNLQKIDVEQGSKYYYSANGVLYANSYYDIYSSSYWKNTLIKCPSGYLGENFVIPEGTKYIRESAATDCVNVKSVSIPDSVTGIGSTAFSGCINLYDVSLSNSVTELRGEMFEGCTSLVEVIIPEGVTFLGMRIFNGCSSLENVKLPSSLTVIYPKAFMECSSLKSIVIPDGVILLGSDSFRDCKSLTSVTIPKSITQIEYQAFIDCKNISDVYYGGSESEWYKIDIQFNNDDLRYAKKHFNSGMSDGELNVEDVVKQSFLAVVFDKNSFAEDKSKDKEGSRLNGVNVKLGDLSTKFDRSILMSSDYSGKSAVFTKQGYYDYIIPKDVMNAFFTVNKGKKKNIYMSKDRKDGKPYVSTVFARQSNSKKTYVELQDQKLVITPDKKFDLILSGKGNGNLTYYLSQDAGHTISRADGVFNDIEFRKYFVQNKKIYAYVKDSTGAKSEPIELKLDYSALKLPEESLSLFGKEAPQIKITKDNPLLGGGMLSFDGFIFPYGYDIDGDHIKFSLGVDLFSEKIYDDEESTKTDWESFKKQFNYINEAAYDAEKKFKEYDKISDKLNKGEDYHKKGVNFKSKLLGYIEGDVINGHLYITDFGGELVSKVMFEHSVTVATPVGPVYGKAGFGVTGCASVKGVLYNKELEKIVYDLIYKVGAILKLGGGIGSEGVASLGGYCEGTAPLKIDFTDKHITLDLEGEVGIEATFLIFPAYKHTFIKGKIPNVINYRYGQKSMVMLPDRFQNNSIKNNINISNETKSEELPKVMPRDYLKNTSAWLGDSKKRTRSAKAVSDGLEVRELQTSVFKNTQAQTITLDDGRMISAWIADNPKRDDYNRMQLVYSVYENDVWSEPKAVADDGTNDNDPALATDGKNIFVVWQNIKRTFNDTDSAESVLPNSEICLAKYNSEKDTFEDIKTLTNDDAFDYTPVIAVENGSPVVYWIKSVGNDLSKAGSNIVYRYANGKTSTVLNNSNYILDIDCAFVDGKDELSFSTDVDGDLSTTNDIKVFTLLNGSKIQRTLTEEEIETADTNVAYGKLDGKTTLFFSDERDIYYVQNGETKSVLTDTRQIAGHLQVLNDGAKTTLLWTEATEIGNEIWTCTYENGAWSEPVQLSKIGALLGDIGAVYNNGQIKGVLSRTQRVKQSDGSYKNGQTDLCFMQLNDFTDLEASFVEFTEAEFVKGQTAKLPVYLKNNGTKQIDKVNVKITDTLGTNLTAEYEVALASGEEKYIDVDYKVPTSYYNGTLNITVTPVGDEDLNTADNSDSKDIGYADISIGEITVEDLENYYVLSATLSNDNQTVANNVQVVVRSGSEDGEALDTVDIGSLQIGEQRSITYVVNKETAKNVENGIGKIYFTATTDNEKMTDDNSSGAAFEIGEAAPPCEHVSGEWEVVKEPTEAETGLKQRKCALCGEVIEEAVIPALGKKVASGYCGATTKWSFYDSGALKISGTGIVKHYAKPAAVPWNKYAEQIKSVYVGDGITRIGEFAFYGCKNLESVTIANSVKEISGYVFKNCSALTEITLPKNLEKIGDSAFYGTGLAKIKIPATVKSIDYYAFSRCYSLKNIEFLGNAPVFYSNAFNKVVATVNYPANNSTWTAAKKQQYGGTLKWVQAGLIDEGLCGSTTSWKLSADGTLTISGTGIVKNYSSYTLVPWLKYADQIKRVVVEEGVTRIGEFAFYGCTNLTSVTLPNSLKEINGYVFKKCSSLTQITLPGGLTKIGDSAFYGTGLKKLTIPANVKYVGWYAFSRCMSLTEAEFLGSAPELPGKAFNMVTATVYYPSGNSSWNNVAWNKLGGTITHKAK